MDLNWIWDKLLEFAKVAEAAIPGMTGPEKKAWCVEEAMKLLENGETIIPLLAAWADLPIVENGERYLLGLAVERAWVVLQLTA